MERARNNLEWVLAYFCGYFWSIVIWQEVGSGGILELSIFSIGWLPGRLY